MTWMNSAPLSRSDVIKYHQPRSTSFIINYHETFSTILSILVSHHQNEVRDLDQDSVSLGTQDLVKGFESGDTAVVNTGFDSSEMNSTQRNHHFHKKTQQNYMLVC